MSIQPSGDSYQDVEVQTLKFEGSLGPSQQNDFARFTFEEEVLGPNGLDRDLVAELIWADFDLVGWVTQQDTATNTTPGSGDVKAGIGINTSAEAYPNFIGGSNVDQAEVDGPANSAAEGNVADDPGVLWFDRFNVAPAFNDTVNGTGGGQHYDHVGVSIPYAQILEHGPIVDATDDIQSEGQLTHDALGGTTAFNLNATLWWRVHEIEGARPQFGLPNR